MRRTAITILLAFALAFVACSDGGGDDTDDAPSTLDPQAAEDAIATLQTSVGRLAGSTSARVIFEWDVERDGFHIRGNGEYTVADTGQSHLEAHYRGNGSVPQPFEEANDSELLVLGESVYLKTPPLGDGWVLFTPAELAADWDVLQRLAGRRSAFDYQTAIRSVDRVDAVGREDIDGDGYTRYSVALDAGVLMNALADAYGTQGQTMLADRFSGPIDTRIWLHESTTLPRRLTADGEFTYLDEPAAIKLTVDFLDFDEEPDFPEAPVDAIPISELQSQ